MKLNNDEIIVKRNYNEMKEIWNKNDCWHMFTYQTINKFVNEQIKSLIKKDSIILNAGSGDTFYDFDCLIYDCDIAESKLTNSKHPIVASIQDLPFSNNYFDVIICVGSVLNYCDATRTISEFSRVMKPKSYLLLEFERSNSGEFLFSKKYARNVFSNCYKYNNQFHRLWMYSEKYISGILAANGFRIIKIKRFHLLSSFISKFKDENYSAKFAKYDGILKPFSKLLAHNIVLLAER